MPCGKCVCLTILLCLGPCLHAWLLWNGGLLGTIKEPWSGEVWHQPGDRGVWHQPGDRGFSFRKKETLKVKKVDSLGPHIPQLMEVVWKAVKPLQWRLVKRDEWLEKGLEVFLASSHFLSLLFPDHGHNVTSWLLFLEPCLPHWAGPYPFLNCQPK